MTQQLFRHQPSRLTRVVASGLLALQAAIVTTAISEFTLTVPGVSPSHAAHAQDKGSADAIYRKAASAVVYIKADQNDGYSTGSGVIIDSSGIIVTNAHVVEGAQQVSVELSDGRNFEAKVISQGSKDCLDIAILKIQGTNLPKLNFSAMGSLQKGERVFAIGYPKGIKPSAITQGIVSNLYTERGMIQTDTTLIPGNSGGALLNSRGELVGINTLKGMDDQTGMNFAISSDKVQDLLLALKQGVSPSIGQVLIPASQRSASRLAPPLSLEGIMVSGRLQKADSMMCLDSSRAQLYTFQGRASQSIMLDMTSSEMGSFLMVLDPNGRVLAKAQVEKRNQIARILSNLPTTGTYTVIANATQAERLGSYYLQATIPLLVVEANKLSDIDPQFSNGSPYRSYRFTGKAGQTIAVALHQFDFAPYLILRDANGKVVVEGSADRQGTINIKLPQDGFYELIVSTVKPSDRGQFSLSIHAPQGNVSLTEVSQK